MRVPSSTYRLQINSFFRFKDASDIVDYLHALGISDIYASPVFRARKGSPHGYDIVDHGSINPEVGTIEELESLFGRLRGLGMGWLQDFVPNHMAYDGENGLLMDVLEKGRASRYAGFFDIEWDHPYEGIKEKVLAPFLGRIYGEALEGGEIRLDYSDDGLKVRYYETSFPLRIDSYQVFLSHLSRKLVMKLGKEHPDYVKLLGIRYVLKTLAAGGEAELGDQAVFVKRMLWELYTGNRDFRFQLDESLAAFNGSPGDPESYNLLDKLLSEQSFKLAFWKVAAEETNYRRFFNINGLITLRTEDEEVFEKTHALILRLLRNGATGVRLDHIDGLLNPLEYLRKLRDRAGDAYIVVEKILGSGEALPQAWPVEGTTGYDFMSALNGIFCDTTHESRFTRIYSSFTGIKSRYAYLFHEKKKLITEMDMMSDVSNLAQLLKLTLSRDRHGSDITLPGLKRAIVEVMAAFPVYRTYICAESVTETDLRYIREAVESAIARNPALYNELAFIGKVLALDFREYQGEEEKGEWLKFVMRFQQFTGPLMAKGIEDTLFYVYNRLISLNEVGSSPGQFGSTVEAFHSRNRIAAKSRPHSMSATSTHDTKRGEDARARINVLSEMPGEWEAALRRWSAVNRKRKRRAGGLGVPDRNDEYFLYQTLLGSFPFGDGGLSEYRERIKAYMKKAVREAKIHTAWLRPDMEYEEGFMQFIDAILSSPENGFLKEFLPLQKKTAWYGMINSLSQLVLKAASPGVPDFYQGTELWDLSLVDPDNRRPVDFGKRKALLDEIINRTAEDRSAFIRELLAAPEDGRIKLFVTHAALNERRSHHELFRGGAYEPIETEGRLRRHLVAFARVLGEKAAMVLAPRFMTQVVLERQWPLGPEVWEGTFLRLPEGLKYASWQDAFTGRELKLNGVQEAGAVLGSFPAALLIKM
ncbi:MAG: malto-oligosyltrehalose synthase [Deltaproteobacteria bacterium]|nr:malto-oligosyltrehalose synthase [Deltaproteobacteria bacterium]MBZ0219469.1 malto-oligosyltrehalose synthase [Deltaproteobacteria bacterium]